MNIYRQHDETELSEIYGMDCKKIMAVPSGQKDIVHCLYLYVGSIWLRIFINAELLFVDECEGPDPEDDLDEDEEYIDYWGSLEKRNNIIESACMKAGVFTIVFRGGAILMLSETEGGTLIKKNN